MKIFFALFITVAALFSDHIRWQNDFDAALFKAKAQKKELLLLVLKKECAASKKIFVEVFSDKEVQKEVNRKYIAVVVFFEYENSYPIELFYTQTFPTLFFVSSRDESYLQKPLRGYFTKEDVLKSL
ncbi:MAG: thioredoxin family protein [Sulfurimonas sp.]|uniref:thioredoxin family protein n=1 Tax=Sulfurimonas sp. TaxID=2022749 RepID=UPI0028CDFB6B|nr:thioredoxin family protein [Sulfurimonas sp.]MDT8339737.1 thioredoxin family protein [Sulfurimonas sp.]